MGMVEMAAADLRPLKLWLILLLSIVFVLVFDGWAVFLFSASNQSYD
jgi:hypothetical protein